LCSVLQTVLETLGETSDKHSTYSFKNQHS
jgi:hypothetical protein